MPWWKLWNRVSRDTVDGYEPKRPADVDPWRQPEVMAEVVAHAPSTGSARWDQANLDAFRNELTGLGAWERDKTFGGQQGGPTFVVDFITRVAARDRWRGSDLGARLVETLPDEMTREGWDVQVQPSDEDEEDNEAKADAFPPGGGPPQATPPPMFGAPPPVPQGSKPVEIDDEGIEVAEAVDSKLEELGALEQLWYALCYERAYGGAAILLGTKDGFADDLTKPLDPEDVDEVTHLTAFAGGWDGELVAWSYYRDIAQKNYGMPEMYMLRNLGVPIAKVPAPGEPVTRDILPKGGSSNLITWVHESRLLVFPGIAADRQARVQMRGWGDSLFMRVDRVLQQYDQTWAGVANLMTDFAQGILKIEGLAQALMANNRAGTGTVTNRGRALNLGRSVAGLLMLDSKEDFKREMASLAGLPEVLQQFALRLAAAADMPVSLLMGQAPAGLNATGDSEIRWFYDRVAARQKRRMMPQLKKLVQFILRSKSGPTDGAEPGRWSVVPRALYQLSATEKADRYQKIAAADVAYMGQGVVTAEEVAATRFGGSEYNDGPIVIDLEGRQEMQKQLEADQAEREKAMAAAQETASRQQEEMHQAKIEATKNGEGQEQEAPMGENEDAWDPDQPRDENGRWAGGGGGGGPFARSGGGRGSGGGGGGSGEGGMHVLAARAASAPDAKGIIAARAEARAAARVAAKMGPKPAVGIKTPRPAQAPPQTETEKKIKALRVRAQVQEENRVFNHEKKQAAIAEVTQAAKDHPTLSGWSDPDNASVELIAHRVSPTAEGRRWSVTNWAYQTAETYHTPGEAAKRFVDIVGHEKVKGIIKKAKLKSEAMTQEQYRQHEERQRGGFLKRIAKWFGEDSNDVDAKLDELPLEDWIEEIEKRATAAASEKPLIDEKASGSEAAGKKENA